MTNLFARAKVPLICVSLALLATLSLSLTSLFSVRLLCALLLLCFLPGFLAIRAFFTDLRLDLLEELLLAVGLSYAILMFSTTLIYYVVGRVTLFAILLAYDILLIILAAVSYWRPKGHTGEDVSWKWRRYLSIVLVIGAVGAYLRLVGLGYADPVWDEAYVAWRTVAVANGEPNALFAHTNPAGQVLIAGTFGLLFGGLNEFMLRLPFALAGISGIIAIYLAGREALDEITGLAASALVAVNGFFVAFARVVQYQSVVLLMAALCLWASYKFYKSGIRAWLVIIAVLLAAGFFAHYDMGFVFPGLLYLLWKKRPTEQQKRKAYYKALFVMAMVFLALASIFFVPYLLSSDVARPGNRLAQVFGGQLPYNHLDQLWGLSLFFGSIYYMVLLTCLLAMAFMATLKTLSLQQLGYACGVGGGVTLLLAFHSGLTALDWSLPVSTALFAFLITSPGSTVEYKAVLIWFAIPFFLYAFFTYQPAIHCYPLFVGGSILAAIGCTNLIAALRRAQWPWGRKEGVVATVTVLLTLSCLYFLSSYGAYLLFTRSDLEYLITYPKYQDALFWVDISTRERHKGETWGLPLRQGWQMVGHLYRTGALRGDWGSNDKGRGVEWYTLGIPRNDNCYPRYYFLVEDPLYGTVKVPEAVIERDYTLMGRVWANDELRMRIYTLAPDREKAPEVQDFHEPACYDTYTTLEMLNPPLESPGNANVNLANKVRFIGYQVDRWEARPGGTLVVTLFWQTMQPMTERYKVFLHVEDERLWGQHDSEPRCGLWPTDGWTVGQVVLDRHLVPLDQHAPEGEHPLMVGMYDPSTGERLPVLDERGTPQGDHIVLGNVIIRAPADGMASSQVADE